MTEDSSFSLQFPQNQSPISIQSQCEQKKKIKNRKDFTSEDDMVLIELVRIYGPKFHKFLKFFKRKNLNQLKNRYYKKLRYNQMDKDLYKLSHNSGPRVELKVQELTKCINQLPFSEDVSSLIQNLVIGLANFTQHS